MSGGAEKFCGILREQGKKVSLIVAMTPERIIGLDNSLPWHMPEDLKLFRRITMGNIIIMGRKTYESIGRPLPGRKSFVISSSAASVPPGGKKEAPASADSRDSFAEGGISSGAYEGSGPFYFPSLEDALAASGSAEGEPFIIGGASVYRQAMQYADVLYLSMIRKSYEGNVYFPDFDRSGWEEQEKTDYGEFVLHVLRRKG